MMLLIAHTSIKTITPLSNYFLTHRNDYFDS